MNELIYKAVFQGFFEMLVSACKINRFRERLFVSCYKSDGWFAQLRRIRAF